MSLSLLRCFDSHSKTLGAAKTSGHQSHRLPICAEAVAQESSTANTRRNRIARVIAGLKN